MLVAPTRMKITKKTTRAASTDMIYVWPKREVFLPADVEILAKFKLVKLYEALKLTRDEDIIIKSIEIFNIDNYTIMIKGVTIKLTVSLLVKDFDLMREKEVTNPMTNNQIAKKLGDKAEERAQRKHARQGVPCSKLNHTKV